MLELIKDLDRKKKLIKGLTHTILNSESIEIEHRRGTVDIPHPEFPDMVQEVMTTGHDTITLKITPKESHA